MARAMIALVVLCIIVSPGAYSLDLELMQQLATRIRLLVNEANVPQNDALLHAAFVRLSFHDCTAMGGCNGCLNLRIDENNGLEDAIGILERFYNGTYMRLTTSDISRADLWQLASLVSINYGIFVDGPDMYTPPDLMLERFKWGRKDCPTSPDDPRETPSEFPSAIVGFDETVGFFESKFGFTHKQTLALMGVHALGNAKRRNSGFAGAWSHKKTAISNRFYNHLTDFTWTTMRINQGSLSGPKSQWTHPRFLNGVCMLNSDMALLRNIKPDDNGYVHGQCGERHSRCGLSPTAADFTRYARNNTRWLDDFAEVYNLMTHRCGNNRQGAVEQCQTMDLGQSSAPSAPTTAPTSPRRRRRAAGTRNSAEDFVQGFTASSVYIKQVQMPWRTSEVQ